MVDAPDHYRNRLISKSHISSFSFCPYQYKQVYVDKTVVQEENFAMTTGIRFHQWADVFIRIAPDYRPADWEQLIHPDFSEYERPMLEWFIDIERRRLIACDYDLDLWTPIFSEKTILNETLGIGGTIDRLDKFGGGYCLVEYKTGKSIYKPGLQVEFGFYKYLLNNDPDYNDYPVVMGMVINPRLQRVELMKPSYEKTILKYIDKVKDIRNGGEAPRKCSEAKLSMCSCKCSIEDSGLFNQN